MSASTQLGAIQGFMDVEHRVPPGCVVVGAKCCEGCSRDMFVELGTRYCPVCVPEFSTFDEGLFSVFFREAMDKAWGQLCRL